VNASDLVRRGCAAYVRAGTDPQPSSRTSTVQRLNGLWYVVLRSGRTTLGVYRIKPDGRLRKLRRWPDDLNHGM
jgi:hypothetical protein